MMTLNARTGEIVTLVGGYDFHTNQTNYATAEPGMTGTLFMPFIYTAAVESGMTPDFPVTGDPIKKGTWEPHNLDGSRSNSVLPMKVAFARQLHIPAIHLMDNVGIQTTSQMVRRFGLSEPMSPYLAAAYGTDKVPLTQMVSAYSAFANHGDRVEPHLIRQVLDAEGNTLEQRENAGSRVMSEYVASTMVSMMQGVFNGISANQPPMGGFAVAGMPGTVADHPDAWFIGYTPTYVTGVWIGYPDHQRSLGNDASGEELAKPLFTTFMTRFLRNKPPEQFAPPLAMPSEMQDLLRQREREAAEERLRLSQLP
jgi:penicillin-binding protein 1A